MLYRDGFLKTFIDTWDLHKIGSTKISLSERQAENIAMESAKTYTWTIGAGDQIITINNFNVTKPVVKQLMFSQVGNANNARDSDQLALYPMWHIGVGLDKYYPGNVYGIYVDIWADTGQIKDIYEAFSTLPPPNNETATIAESSINNQTPVTVYLSSFPPTWVPFAAFSVIATTAIIVFSLWLFRKKTSLHNLYLPIQKFGAPMLCILISSVAFVLPTANATVANV